MVDPKIVPQVSLNNGKSVPIVGLGTWQSPPDGSVYKAVKAAIENGYRHLDCAYIYQNQSEIGKAIADVIAAGVVKREELFIVSKIWLTFFRKDRVSVCLKTILKDLQLDYADLILLHWPFSFKQGDELFPLDGDGKVIDGEIDYIEAWQALEALCEQGLVKSIGVSNFSIEQIERLLGVAKIKPVTNQVECHPYLTQKKLKEYCDSKQITLTAYSPLGNPGSTYTPADKKKDLLNDPVVKKLAQKYNKSSGQILIRFHVDRGILVIPKSVKTERLIENLSVFDFKLSPEDLSELLALNQNYRSCAFQDAKHLKNYTF